MVEFPDGRRTPGVVMCFRGRMFGRRNRSGYSYQVRLNHKVDGNKWHSVFEGDMVAIKYQHGCGYVFDE